MTDTSKSDTLAICTAIAKIDSLERKLTLAVKAIGTACGIIELGDQRLLANDGPAGGQPPAISLNEWKQLYRALDKARRQIEEAP